MLAEGSRIYVNNISHNTKLIFQLDEPCTINPLLQYFGMQHNIHTNCTQSQVYSYRQNIHCLTKPKHNPNASKFRQTHRSGYSPGAVWCAAPAAFCECGGGAVCAAVVCWGGCWVGGGNYKNNTHAKYNIFIRRYWQEGELHRAKRHSTDKGCQPSSLATWNHLGSYRWILHNFRPSHTTHKTGKMQLSFMHTTNFFRTATIFSTVLYILRFKKIFAVLCVVCNACG